ncbi:MAG: hypothetical protein ACM31C_32485 [Acidobacteriota bacterium]
MTDRKDLKRRIRDRQAKTGESYMTARMHVLAERRSATGAVPFVDTVDCGELAARLGMRCHVVITATLVELLSAELVLERIRTALVVSETDPAADLMRAIVFNGENPPELLRTYGVLALRAQGWNGGELRRFIARARAGIGGISSKGHLLALTIHDVPVLACVSPWPVAHKNDRAPALFVGAIDALV